VGDSQALALEPAQGGVDGPLGYVGHFSRRLGGQCGRDLHAVGLAAREYPQDEPSKFRL
jgi:hypothetical protein